MYHKLFLTTEKLEKNSKDTTISYCIKIKATLIDSLENSRHDVFPGYQSPACLMKRRSLVWPLPQLPAHDLMYHAHDAKVLYSIYFYFEIVLEI